MLSISSIYRNGLSFALSASNSPYSLQYAYLDCL